MRKSLFFLLGLAILTSCIDDGFNSTSNNGFPEGDVIGYRPVYRAISDPYEIREMGIQPMVSVGKILLVGKTLLVNERNEGIHIIDNSNPSQPRQTGFIQIPGNLELSKKGDYIYANNIEDLVTLQVSSDGAVTVTDRKAGVFPDYSHGNNLINTIPFGSYFECVDASKGYVVRWEQTTITNPKCRK